jgi:NADH-quinone oxidoreductase subunit J
MEFYLFCFFSFCLLFCCFFVCFVATPINAVFYLVLAFCNATGLLILVEAEFLAILFIIVYVGAIAVLFLFVIIMLNLKDSMRKEVSFINSSYFFFLTLCVLSFLFSVFLQDAPVVQSAKAAPFVFYKEWIFFFDNITNIVLFGQVLYTYFAFYFLVAGFILLVAMVSAVALTSQKRFVSQSISRKQLVHLQLSRSANNAVFLLFKK